MDPKVSIVFYSEGSFPHSLLSTSQKLNDSSRPRAWTPQGRSLHKTPGVRRAIQREGDAHRHRPNRMDGAESKLGGNCMEYGIGFNPPSRHILPVFMAFWFDRSSRNARCCVLYHIIPLLVRGGAAVHGLNPIRPPSRT